MTVDDADDDNLEGATVKIDSGFVYGEDVLGFADTDEITGLWNPDTGVLTLSGTSSTENYQAGLRSVTYENVGGDDITSGARTIIFRVNDGQYTFENYQHSVPCSQVALRGIEFCSYPF